MVSEKSWFFDFLDHKNRYVLVNFCPLQEPYSVHRGGTMCVWSQKPPKYLENGANNDGNIPTGDENIAGDRF